MSRPIAQRQVEKKLRQIARERDEEEAKQVEYQFFHNRRPYKFKADSENSAKYMFQERFGYWPT